MDPLEKFTSTAKPKTRKSIALSIADSLMYVIDSGDYTLLVELDEPAYTDKDLLGSVREKHLASALLPHLTAKLCQKFVDDATEDRDEALSARDANEALNDMEFRRAVDVLVSVGIMSAEY